MIMHTDEFKDEIKQIMIPDETAGALSISDFDVDQFRLQPGELSVSDFDVDHFAVETVWSDTSSNLQLVRSLPWSSEWSGTECRALPVQLQESDGMDPRPVKRKRTREISTKVDHHGVAMWVHETLDRLNRRSDDFKSPGLNNRVSMDRRFDGLQERFTAYYRPSYWHVDDGAVFLGTSIN